MAQKDEWKQDGTCKDFDTELFFDKYEQDLDLRPAVDEMCSMCPVAKMCFAVGISTKEYGVWGGVYLDAGKISREFNRHKTKVDWANTWQNLTIEQD